MPAADQEDALEKLPVTPGPIVPAREQLAELLLAQKRAKEAVQEFTDRLVDRTRAVAERSSGRSQRPSAWAIPHSPTQFRATLAR